MRFRLLGTLAAVLGAAVVAAAQPSSPPKSPTQGPGDPGSVPREGQPPLPVSPPPRTVTGPSSLAPPAAPELPPALFPPAPPDHFGWAVPARCPTGCDPEPKANDPYHHLGPWRKVWVRSGYTMLFTRRPSLPAAVATTGNTSQSPFDSSAGYGGFSGMFVDGGMWLNERHTYGVGFGGFLTEQRSSVIGQVGSGPNGDPTLSRPFFNPTLAPGGGPDALIVSAPGRFAGSIAVETGARLAGAEVNGLLSLANTASWSATFVAGFRYFDLDEYLTIYQVTAGLNGNTIPVFGSPAGVTGVAVTDRVRTRNQFFGGQLGLETEYRWGPAFFGLGTKLGIGPVHQVTQITGQTVMPGGPSGPGGFLAVGTPQGGNIGNSTTNPFAVLLDLHTTVGVQISNHCRLGVGYEFLYLNNVARPGDQFDTSIDPRLIPTAPQFNTRIPAPAAGQATPPRVPVERTDFIVHGVRVSVTFQY